MMDSVATALGCSHGLAYSMMCDCLKFREVCTWWVPRELKDEMRPYLIPGHYKPSTRKQSALTATFVMQVFDCDHTMEKYSLTAGKKCLVVFKTNFFL
jgi:hypothetical protein